MAYKTCVVLAAVCISSLGFHAYAADKAGEPAVESAYTHYSPDFMKKRTAEAHGQHKPPEKLLKLSAETTFYTRSFVDVSSRADALVRAGIEKEKKGDFRLALDIYQQVIDTFPDVLYRISPYGVYLPVGYYCQLRILNFPRKHLEFYREKNDSRAREAFEISKKKNSMEGLAYIRDTMLCTSYGAKAMLVLGDAELDRGHYLAALEYFNTVKTYFPEKEVHTPELTLKIAYCRKMLGEKVDIRMPKNLDRTELGSEKVRAFYEFIQQSSETRPELFLQRSSPDAVTADDYMHMIPTHDPYAVKDPVWKTILDGSHGDFHVRFNPAVTEKSVIYRHKNIVYCRSLLNGELRWKNDLGGRVDWQTRRRVYVENILVHDGMVFTPMYKNGPTLMALDETTGQLKWSYGPMLASTRDEALMRFKSAPAAGPSTVYAGYYLDNIDSGVHIDTEYGVIAFESRTGRVKWRRSVCSLRPGKFAVSFGSGVRLRVRSFVTPPLYHQGTVYYCTSAGTVAALDALSGRIKWLMKYPYYIHPGDIHDASRGFGGRHTHIHPPGPMLWLNQRPLVIGDDLYVLPVDSKFMYKLDRRTGKVLWSHQRRDQVYDPPHSYGSYNCGGSTGYFMGPVRSGKLLFVYSFRAGGKKYSVRPQSRHGRPMNTPGGIFLVNPQNGGVVWASRDPVAHHSKHPTVYGNVSMGKAGQPNRFWTIGINRYQYQVTARPFLTRADNLYVSGVAHGGYYIRGFASNLAVLDLEKKAFREKRRHFLDGQMLTRCADAIRCAPYWIKRVESEPRKTKQVKNLLKRLKAVANDTVPENEYPEFFPFSRVTFKRYGTVFELRVSPRDISMLYDRDKVKKTVTAGTDPESTFAAAELAIAEDRLEESAKAMESCLRRISPEDLGFRHLVNQQLYRVYRRLVRGSIRKRDIQKELTYVTGMSRSSTTLADEIQTLFAISEVYGHTKEFSKASRYLQGIVRKYGAYEYGVSSLYHTGADTVASYMKDVVSRSQKYVKGLRYEDLFARSIGFAVSAVPLYYSAVSPVEKDLTVRSEQVAVTKLLSMQAESAEFRSHYEKEAGSAFSGKGMDEKLVRLIEYPGTEAGQKVVDEILSATDRELAAAGEQPVTSAELRKQLWRIADISRLCDFRLPDRFRKTLLAPQKKKPVSLGADFTERELDMEEARGPAWLVLERRGEKDVRPELVFLGGRVKKKFDNKFLLYAVDTKTGKTVWKAAEKRGKTWFDEIRLRGKGNEPGFSEAFVCGDIVVVHGLFDVLAFNLSDGKLRWRYRVPFNFEIRHAVKSGGLLACAGESETVVLYLPTGSPGGEVVWQEKEQGDIYRPPWFYGDRLVSVRMMPFSVTVRYRSTGKLIGRMSIDSLMLRRDHPLLDKGRESYPLARDGRFLALCGGGYYIMLDIENMKRVWKRLIDVDSNTPVRMELNGDYLAVIKKDYDVEAIYMLSSRTGNVLWRTDPKNAKSPRPVYSMIIRNGKLFGIRKHPGQGFYFTGMDCSTGKPLFRQSEQKGYKSIPSVRIRRNIYGRILVAEVKDRQNFELKVFDTEKGKPVHTVKIKGLGDFGEHGRASAAVQNGCMVLHGKHTVKIASP